MKKIILSGGGTAGHIWPLISLAKKMPDYEILFLGSGDKRERDLVESAGIKYKKILSGKYRRYFSIMNFIDPFKVLIGIIQSKYYLLTYRPNFVFAKGGFVTVPLGIACFFLFKKLYIHESDSIMGLANRILSKFAKKIFTAYPAEYYPKKLHKKIIWSGLPIRPEILTGDRGKVLDQFNFKQNLPVVLFIGGSLGASGINNLVFKSIEKLLDICQVVHLTGKRDFGKARDIFVKLNQQQKERYRYFEFVKDEIADIYALSDIVVTRCGATTLTELAGLKKPIILIPYPYSASNHQLNNAQIYYKNHAGILMEEANTSSEDLFHQIKRLIENKEAVKILSENIAKFYKSDSLEIIINQIEGK